MKTVARYLSLVKFSHTVFALPFALTGYICGLIDTGGFENSFDWLLLVKILFCMVFARNTAMGFNRWADRRFDAENPRTAGREIPAGEISPRAALAFTLANAVGFMVMAGFINKLALVLSPLALFIIMGYSLTKRFTAWSHIVLGVALSIAPIGAYIAVTGGISIIPIMLGATVVTWVAGFDILYAFQDAEHDRTHNLYSIPARYGNTAAVLLSILLHLVTSYTVVLTGVYYGAGTLYWVGAFLFIAILISEHILLTPRAKGRIAAVFGIINGTGSVLYAAFMISDLLLSYFVA